MTFPVLTKGTHVPRHVSLRGLQSRQRSARETRSCNHPAHPLHQKNRLRSPRCPETHRTGMCRPASSLNSGVNDRRCLLIIEHLFDGKATTYLGVRDQ